MFCARRCEPRILEGHGVQLVRTGLDAVGGCCYAIGGREGLVDTAVKTSMNRVCNDYDKSMEDNCARTDGTIRNTPRKTSLSFLWGTDALHPARVERCTLHALSEPEETLRSRLHPHIADFAVECLAEVFATRDTVLGASEQLDRRVLLPFHPERMKQKIRRAPHAGELGLPTIDSDLSCEIAREVAGADDACDAFGRPRVPRVVSAAMIDVLSCAEARFDEDRFRAVASPAKAFGSESVQPRR